MIKHHYRECGSGEPLILLHGNGEESGYFEHQMEPFGAHFHVIALDTRGHGQTPRGSAPFTIAQFAEDLLEFLDNQGIERAHLLGFSDGGNIALRFAIAHPERVKKLVLNGANLNGRGVRPLVQWPIVAGYWMTSLAAQKSEEARKKNELLGLMVNEPHITTAELEHIKAPTLVIAGTRDMIRRNHTRLIARHIAGAELCFIKGDHFIAARNPEAFNSRVLQFLCEG